MEKLRQKELYFLGYYTNMKCIAILRNGIIKKLCLN